MKKILLILGVIAAFASCKKETPEPVDQCDCAYYSSSRYTHEGATDTNWTINYTLDTNTCEAEEITFHRLTFQGGEIREVKTYITCK